MSKVAVFGQGHIGLPTALTIAANGHSVTGVDINSELVARLSAGFNELIEPGLSELLESCLEANAYRAAETTPSADVYIVSVPTPLDESNRPRLDFVIAAATSIAPTLKNGALVILESTVPPGTTRGRFTEALESHSKLRANLDFYVAHCPERVLPGTILKEIVENDRVVGGTSPKATDFATEFYSEFVSGEIFKTDDLTAELVKLYENIYRDVNIGLANELASSTEELGGDVWRVIELANKHPRVNIHQPGPGVGGYCIPVASWMLMSGLKSPSPLISEARIINSDQPTLTVQRTIQIVREYTQPKIAVLGTAYKGGVGDARMTPTVEIVEALLEENIEVDIHDPLTTNFKYQLVSLEQALNGSDLLLVLTDHPQFTSLNPSKSGELMRTKNVLDTRNILDADQWKQAGFKVEQLGVRK